MTTLSRVELKDKSGKLTIEWDYPIAVIRHTDNDGNTRVTETTMLVLIAALAKKIEQAKREQIVNSLV